MALIKRLLNPIWLASILAMQVVCTPVWLLHANDAELLSVVYKSSVSPTESLLTVEGRFIFKRLNLAPTSIPLKIIPTPSTIAGDIKVHHDYMPAPIIFNRQDDLFTASVDISTLPSDNDSLIVLSVTYDVVTQPTNVDNAFNIHIPIVWAEGYPTSFRKQLFRARVELPSTYSILASFPVRHTKLPDIAYNQRYRFNLPVTPTFIRLQGHVGRTSFWETIGRLDIIMLLLIGSVCGAGVFWLRRAMNT